MGILDLDKLVQLEEVEVVQNKEKKIFQDLPGINGNFVPFPTEPPAPLPKFPFFEL